MPKFVVEGGLPLSGTIRPAGNKIAALPIRAATLLTDQEMVLENVPAVRDVQTMVELLGKPGAECEWTGQNEIQIRAANVGFTDIELAPAARIRASILLAGPTCSWTNRA